MIVKTVVDLSNWGKPFPMGVIAFDDSGKVYSEYCDTVEEFSDFFKAHKGNYNEDTVLSFIIDPNELESCSDMVKTLRLKWKVISEAEKLTKEEILSMVESSVDKIFAECQKKINATGDISPTEALILDGLEKQLTELIYQVVVTAKKERRKE